MNLVIPQSLCFLNLVVVGKKSLAASIQAEFVSTKNGRSNDFPGAGLFAGSAGEALGDPVV